jgi:hypothetical protein
MIYEWSVAIGFLLTNATVVYLAFWVSKLQDTVLELESKVRVLDAKLRGE